ncbi:glycoside hydrolase family 66 protein [Microbacterium immunditiarum]|uniref:Dextranase n=1 Tax=Microbacterium immunditiarum TaxID=337480 RepID=A0A7Y9GKI4_9MICO|nr:glycoside hydrolase family 66 protein [Microbacterium immunditiarum]NYE18197.1 dextranase [Microbacterium immunditiarum]
MGDIELLPERGWVRLGEPVVVEVRRVASAAQATDAATGGEIVVWHLGEPIRRIPYTGEAAVDLGALPAGGYGIELQTDAGNVRTAIDVRDDPRARLRYGFAADFSPSRDITGLADLVRRLHLTAIQCYDWAYRHADLLGGGEEYADALERPVSLRTAREIARAVQERGADALGYAAVYAVGGDEWGAWSHDALLTASGEPYALGDFLRVVDPAAPDWLAHLTDELVAATENIGFDGFHLDQYGWPKRAERADGTQIDVAESFAAMLHAVRSRLPGARLVFNQVNDFPTWRTGTSAQDAVYIEPWEPQSTLGALAATVERARAAGGGKPVVVAAYQHVYDLEPAEVADRAVALTMATLFSHGATQLLAGEADRILVDPYYVRNHRVEASTAELLKRWYDFLVAHDELLMPPGIVDVTNAYAGEYNDDCDVSYAREASPPVDLEPVAGAVWRRIRDVQGTLVVHLVNLTTQPDTRWDAPRAPLEPVAGGRLRVRRVRGRMPRVRVADPDGAGRLIDVPVRAEGEDHAVAELPPLRVWQLVAVDPTGRSDDRAGEDAAEARA